jgi:hypothetical protein
MNIIPLNGKNRQYLLFETIKSNPLLVAVISTGGRDDKIFRSGKVSQQGTLTRWLPKRDFQNAINLILYSLRQSLPAGDFAAVAVETRISKLLLPYSLRQSLPAGDFDAVAAETRLSKRYQPYFIFAPSKSPSRGL